MKEARPFHPVLFSAFPVLTLYARNADEVPLRDLVLPLLFAMALGVALMFLLRWLLHDSLRAGIVSSAILLLFFSYGHVWDLVRNRVVGGFIVDRDLYLLIPWAVISAAVLLIAFGARTYLKETTTILNLVALFLAVTSMVPIIRSGGGPPASKGDCPAPLPGRAATGTTPPRDIYYFIFDRYGGSDTLTESYSFDNSAFLSGLTDRGFYVASNSRANYPRTAHSLASSLNAGYLDCIAQRVSPDESDWGPIYDALADHQVGRFLQRSGYSYFHVGSWWEGTAKSPFADFNYSYEGRRGFAQLMYSTTLARPIGEYLGLGDPERVRDFKRVGFQLRTLGEVHGRPGPKFVFGHFLLPHEPYIFDRDGSFQTGVEEQRKGRRDAYIDQLLYTNQVIDDLLNVLLSGPPESRPIIVLQSDEGPHPIRYDIEGPSFDWTRAAPAEINETLRILNAYYLPGVAEPGLYPTITPVNTFRKIFDLYLRTKLGLLPDEVYVYADDDHPYRFEKVSERVWDPAAIAARPPGS
ncbi:MAG: sulfatase-like hydrolase/transferase [Actinomycetota bacterium]